MERFPAVPCSRKCNDLSDHVEAWMAIYLCYQISYENCVADDPVEPSLILSTSAETPNKHALLIRHSFRARRPLLCNPKPKNDITKVLALRLGKVPGPAPRIVAVDKYVARWISTIRFRVLIGP